MPERSSASPVAHAREIDIQQAILLDLGAREDLRVWRNNVGVGVGPSGRPIRFGTPGAADILGIVLIAPGFGRFLALEVKSSTGRLRAEQVAWSEMVRRFGGFYAVVRSVLEARAAVAQARREAIEAARALVAAEGSLDA